MCCNQTSFSRTPLRWGGLRHDEIPAATEQWESPVLSSQLTEPSLPFLGPHCQELWAGTLEEIIFLELRLEKGGPCLSKPQFWVPRGGTCRSGQTHVQEKGLLVRELYGKGQEGPAWPLAQHCWRGYSSLPFKWAREEKNSNTQ